MHLVAAAFAFIRGKRCMGFTKGYCDGKQCALCMTSEYAPWPRRPNKEGPGCQRCGRLTLIRIYEIGPMDMQQTVQESGASVGCQSVASSPVREMIEQKEV